MLSLVVKTPTSLCLVPGYCPQLCPNSILLLMNTPAVASESSRNHTLATSWETLMEFLDLAPSDCGQLGNELVEGIVLTCSFSCRCMAAFGFNGVRLC